MENNGFAGVACELAVGADRLVVVGRPGVPLGLFPNREVPDAAKSPPEGAAAVVAGAV
jgi:hypothetical protein